MIFSNDTKINIFSSIRKVWCWIHDSKRAFKVDCYSNIKYGGGSTLIWKCMFINGLKSICRIKSSFNQFGCKKNLEEQLYKRIRKYCIDASKVTFQQDNAQ